MEREEYKSLGSESEILRNSKKRKGSGLWLEDDATEREEEIQYWLKREKQRIEATGLKVIMKGLAAKMGETYWSWNEDLGDMKVVGVKE